MAEEKKTILLNGGREVEVAVVTKAEDFLTQLLGDAPTKSGLTTLRVVKNTAGKSFVAVLIAGKHAGFLADSDAQDLFPTLADCEQNGVLAQAKGTVTASPDGWGKSVMTLSLAEPGQLLGGLKAEAQSPPAEVPKVESTALLQPQQPAQVIQLTAVAAHEVSTAVPETVVYCRNCGTKNPGASRFCSSCGFSLGALFLSAAQERGDSGTGESGAVRLESASDFRHEHEDARHEQPCLIAADDTAAASKAEADKQPGQGSLPVAKTDQQSSDPSVVPASTLPTRRTRTWGRALGKWAGVLLVFFGVYQLQLLVREGANSFSDYMVTVVFIVAGVLGAALVVRYWNVRGGKTAADSPDSGTDSAGKAGSIRRWWRRSSAHKVGILVLGVLMLAGVVAAAWYGTTEYLLGKDFAEMSTEEVHDVLLDSVHDKVARQRPGMDITDLTGERTADGGYEGVATGYLDGELVRWSVRLHKTTDGWEWLAEKQ